MIALWLCVGYFAVVCALIGARASWGFLRLGSEYREPLVPGELLLAVTDSAARDLRLHATLIAVGFAALCIITTWITRARRP